MGVRPVAAKQRGPSRSSATRGGVSAALARVLKVLPDEILPVTVLGSLLLINSLAMQVSYVSSVSGFLETSGPEGILLVWLADFALIALATGLQSLVVDRFRRGRLMLTIIFGFAACFVGLRVLFAVGAPPGVTYALLYVLAEQQWLFFPLVFWTLANDRFSTAQATRVFPVIASWGFVGQIIGLGLAASAPLFLSGLGGGHADLLMLNAVFYLLAALLVLAFVRHRPECATRRARPEPLLASLREGYEFVREVPVFRSLALVVLGLAVCETVVEFRFLTVSGAAFHSVGAYQEFYGLYRLGTTLVAFLLQLLVTSRVISRLSLKNSFYLAPAAFLTSSLAMLAGAGLAASTGAMTLVKVARDTVDESSRKALQNVVPEERRGRVSMFLDSHLLAAGTIAACLATLALISMERSSNWHGPGSLYLLVGVAGALGAMIGVRGLAATYDSSLLNWRLRRRQRASSILDKLDI